MNVKKIKTFRFFDALICVFVLISALLLFFFGNLGDEGKYFEVNCDGKKTSYRLDKVQSLEFSSNGMTLTVVSDGKEVWVESADCPDKCCVNKGRISRESQIIACAPAKFSVSISGEGELYDAFTH